MDNSELDVFKSKWFRRALIASAMLTFLLVMAGYLVRFEGSQGVCSDWLTCYGNWGILTDLKGQLEVGHRILAFLSGLAVFGTMVWAILVKGTRKSVRIFLGLASAGILVSAVVGRTLVFSLASPMTSNIHLGLALIVMALVTGAAVFGSSYKPRPVGTKRNSSFERLAITSLVITFVLMVSGAWLTTSGAGKACVGWPLCDGSLPEGAFAWLAFSHRLITLAAGISVLAMFFTAWKRYFRNPLILTGATGAALLFAGQVLISALKVSQGYPLDLVGLHAVATAALWGALVITAVAARDGIDSRGVSVESRPMGLARVKAFFQLNKPIIVVLLLVTTFAGMVVGGRQLPDFWLAFWTLLGGALAAGGASALNQVIDREIDGHMQRTAKRPLPSGALTPAEGLAYGLGACLAAFFILAGFVNLLAAVLSLAGMIYYVLLYSVWLKHATVQNIVIGGGAGAIPPLVGWAAASGSLNIPSLFLFAIVFMWTPPHFWALAIVRKNDYARAGVPMLPVVQGERKTRIQIFIYTLELVGLTLLMPLFNMAGSLFLVSAVVLGLWLISAAWAVLRKPGNKVAWMMYRYSSMYLAFIFLALVLDVLI